MMQWTEDIDCKVNNQLIDYTNKADHLGRKSMQP